MRIIISTDNAKVAQHFGRCQEFTVLDIENNKVKKKETVENPEHVPGKLPKLFNEMGANLIIAGGMGRRAQSFLQEFGIDWIIGVQGDIDCVVEDYLNGKLESGESLCVRGEGKGDGNHNCN